MTQIKIQIQSQPDNEIIDMIDVEKMIEANMGLCEKADEIYERRRDDSINIKKNHFNSLRRKLHKLIKNNHGFGRF